MNTIVSNVKKSLALLCCLQISFSLFAQEGIRFESGYSWNEIKQKARNEHKYILLDCYATWCGPCKFMNKEIFSKKQVGDFFNANFINVSIQMDKTSKDTDSIRNWYAQAEAFAKQFGVNSYPTYLFFSPDGAPVHCFVGATSTVWEFIDQGKNAMDRSRQYYLLLAQWEQHKNDSVFLQNTLRASLEASDNKTATKVSEYYIRSLKSPITKENIRLFIPLISSSKDGSFQVINKNASAANDLMGEGFAEHILGPVIFNEEIRPSLAGQSGKLQWEKIAKKLTQKYPSLSGLENMEKEEFLYSINDEISSLLKAQSDSNINWVSLKNKLEKKFDKKDYHPILLKRQAGYYAKLHLWTECLETTYELMRLYGNQMGDRDMNNLAWNYVFLHCNDKKITEEALKWMKLIVTQKPDQSNNIDTYANLLYKAGYKEQAIFWENKAIETGKKTNGDLEDLKAFDDNLEKMKRDEPTWNENS